MLTSVIFVFFIFLQHWLRFYFLSTHFVFFSLKLHANKKLFPQAVFFFSSVHVLIYFQLFYSWRSYCFFFFIHFFWMLWVFGAFCVIGYPYCRKSQQWYEYYKITTLAFTLHDFNIVVFTFWFLLLFFFGICSIFKFYWVQFFLSVTFLSILVLLIFVFF